MCLSRRKFTSSRVISRGGIVLLYEKTSIPAETWFPGITGYDLVATAEAAKLVKQDEWGYT